MKIRFFGAVCAGVLTLSISSSASAEFLSRLNGQAVYDTDRNITWLTNANLAASNTFGVAGINVDGSMTWATAQSWIAAMNTSNYLGYNNWRLPISNTCEGYNCTGSEMGHLFYNELGGVAGSSILTTHNINFALFQNILPLSYWSGTEYVPDSSNAWTFVFAYGGQGWGGKNVSHPVWAVLTGDVASTPVYFQDDFNRPNSSTVGNGWITSAGSISELQIQNNEVINTGRLAGIYRPLPPFTSPVTINATLKEMNGFGGLLRRYASELCILNDGTIGHGYCVLFTRGDQNYQDSAVTLFDNGQQVGRIPSPFQYGPDIQVSVTFLPSGPVMGIVNDSSNTFNFSFGSAGVIHSSGGNFQYSTEGADTRTSIFTYPRLDDLTIFAVDDETSHCEATLPFAWPTSSNASQISQDYARFNSPGTKRPNHYHTGMDLASPISGVPQQVYAIAKGEVVAVCPNGVEGGCRFPETNGKQFSTNSTNHGLQGVTILKHTVNGGVSYSLYGHLGTVEIFQPGECIEQGTIIGATGGLPDAHLHFEIKSSPVLSNPQEEPESCIDPVSGTFSKVCYGYTQVNPNNRGYHDPVKYLHLLDVSGFPKNITLSDDKDKKKAKKINTRSGPGAFGGAYPLVGKAQEGSYTALSRVLGVTTDPSCTSNWYQIRRASDDCSVAGNCFSMNDSSTSSSVPEAWVCGEFVNE